MIRATTTFQVEYADGKSEYVDADFSRIDLLPEYKDENEAKAQMHKLAKAKTLYIRAYRVVEKVTQSRTVAMTLGQIEFAGSGLLRGVSKKK